MGINLKKLEKTFAETEVIYLSTSLHDSVSSRPVSPMNMGLNLFIRTSKSSRKASEMLANPNIAVCAGSFYFTGTAKSLGSVYDEQNAALKKAYMARYPGSFQAEDEFIEADEVFFQLKMNHVSEWVYENEAPVGLTEEIL